jgi:hypothetical protein
MTKEGAEKMHASTPEEATEGFTTLASFFSFFSFLSFLSCRNASCKSHSYCYCAGDSAAHASTQVSARTQ